MRSKYLTIIPLFLPALCLFLNMGSTQNQSPIQPTLTPIICEATANDYVCTVEALADWQSTAIWVEVGNTLTVDYQSGEWRDDFQSPFYDADGGASYICNSFDCAEPMPGYPKGGLIGRIGNGEAFWIGSGMTFESEYSGDLQLRMNDPGYFDNEGAIVVRVSLR